MSLNLLAPSLRGVRGEEFAEGLREDAVVELGAVLVRAHQVLRSKLGRRPKASVLLFGGWVTQILLYI